MAGWSWCIFFVRGCCSGTVRKRACGGQIKTKKGKKRRITESPPSSSTQPLQPLKIGNARWRGLARRIFLCNATIQGCRSKTPPASLASPPRQQVRVVLHLARENVSPRLEPPPLDPLPEGVDEDLDSARRPLPQEEDRVRGAARGNAPRGVGRPEGGGDEEPGLLPEGG